MSEFTPAEDQLTSLFLAKVEKKLPLQEAERMNFVEDCLASSLKVVDCWMENMPEKVRQLFLENHSAKNTIKSYRSDLVVFYEWCLMHHVCPLPCNAPDLVHFLADQDTKGFSMATIKRRASSVSWLHRKAGFIGNNNPRDKAFVKEALINLSRKNRDQKQDKAKELTTGLIREMVMLCKEDKNKMKGLRDRALLLMGFSSALRRSDLAKIRLEDVNMVIQGMEVFISSSKTDQTGRGHVVRVARGEVPATCPVMALGDWLQLSGISEGYLFRGVSKSGAINGSHIHPYTISRTIQSMMNKLERLDATEFSAHSLRSGFASTAAQNGASIQSIKTQGNWKSDGSLMRYIRNREDWDVAASYRLGL